MQHAVHIRTRLLIQVENREYNRPKHKKMDSENTSSNFQCAYSEEV